MRWRRKPGIGLPVAIVRFSVVVSPPRVRPNAVSNLAAHSTATSGSRLWSETRVSRTCTYGRRAPMGTFIFSFATRGSRRSHAHQSDADSLRLGAIGSLATEVNAARRDQRT